MVTPMHSQVSYPHLYVFFSSIIIPSLKMRTNLNLFWNQEGGNHKISLVLCEQVVIIGEWIKMDRWTHHCNSSVKLGSVSLFSKPNKKEILNISLPPTTYCVKVMFSVCLSNCPHPAPVQTCLLCSLYIY